MIQGAQTTCLTIRVAQQKHGSSQRRKSYHTATLKKFYNRRQESHLHIFSQVLMHQKIQMILTLVSKN